MKTIIALVFALILLPYVTKAQFLNKSFLGNWEKKGKGYEIVRFTNDSVFYSIRLPHIIFNKKFKSQGSYQYVINDSTIAPTIKITTFSPSFTILKIEGNTMVLREQILAIEPMDLGFIIYDKVIHFKRIAK